MEEARYSEMSLHLHRTTQSRVPEDSVCNSPSW